MEVIKWEDVAHLYLGCKVMHNGNVVEFKRIDLTELMAAVDYGVMGPEYMGCEVYELKPILRPISSITKMDKEEAGMSLTEEEDNSISFHFPWYGMLVLLRKQFDLFGLIKSGQAIDSTTLNLELQN
jgi:hypothetical protein